MGRVAKESAKVKAHIRYKTQDGHTVPGVTTPLNLLAKPALVPWANRLGLQGIDVSKYVDDKAAIGTLAHAMITDSYRGVETDTSDYSANQIDAAQNSVLSYLEWAKAHRVGEAILIETPLVSERNRFGGTPDIFAYVDTVKELIDIKTGKGIWPEHVYQGAAYRELLREHGHEVDAVRILNVPRSEDESFVEKVCSEDELETGWQVFLHCLAIYNLKKKERR